MSANFGDVGGGPARIDLHITADGPAQKRLRLQERSKEGLKSRIVRGCGQEHANASHAFALLRARRERPRGGRAAEQRDDLAALHHSITSSASASNLSGIWRPSALAVLRLITNSNWVGCSTGKSPGLAPLRIRPT